MATSKGGRKAQQRAAAARDGEVESMAMSETLERKYKPFFDTHAGEGGIPFDVLEQELSGVDENLPLWKLRALIREADTDNNAVLDWNEFKRLMSSGQLKMTKYQTFLTGVLRTAAPQAAQTDVDDYVSQYNCRPPPLFMIIISAVELGIFIGYAVWMAPRGVPTTMISGAPLFSPLTYNPQRRYEAWRYLTYMFVHDGIKHILSNLIFQLLLGLPLEMVHKFWRVGIVYCLGVIAGSLCTSVLDPHIFLVGASGGCYALIGAQFAIIIMNWKEMTDGWLESPVKFITSAPVLLTFWGLYAAVDTGVAIWMRYSNPLGSQTAYAAHFAGLVAGVLIGVPVLRNLNELPWEKVIWWICLVTYLVLVIIAVFLNGFLSISGYYPAPDWRPCCPCPAGYKPCPLTYQPPKTAAFFNKTG